MRGRQILIEPLPGGGDATALLVDGQLHDLLIDPPAGSAPQPEAIFRAVASRPMKGLGGAMVDLGAGHSGLLRSRRLPPPGRPVLVQVGGWAEPGKAPPVGERIRLKGRFAILTPGAPGRNIARSIRSPDLRQSLEALADSAMEGAPDDLGLILRSAAATAPAPAIAREIEALRAEWQPIAAAAADAAPACLRPAPGSAETARRDWWTPDAALREAQEEIGLPPDHAEPLGYLRPYHTTSGFKVIPVVAAVTPGFDIVPDESEVAAVFEVPLAYLADPANYLIEGRYWGGIHRRYYAIPYGPYYIWGATARILRGFAERLSEWHG